MLRYLLMFGMCLSTPIFGDVEGFARAHRSDDSSYETSSRGQCDENGECNKVGPRGEKGRQGPRGESGCEGPRGQRGPNGPNGENGLDGPAGPQGYDGRIVRGPRGATGAAGEVGGQVEGPTGPTGEVGLTGPTGAPTVGPGFIQTAFGASLTGLQEVLGGAAISFDQVDFIGNGSIFPTVAPIDTFFLPREPGFYLVTFGISLNPEQPSAPIVLPSFAATFNLVLRDPPTGPVALSSGSVSAIIPIIPAVVIPNMVSITTIVNVKALDLTDWPTLQVVNNSLGTVALGALPSEDTSAYIRIIKLN